MLDRRKAINNNLAAPVGERTQVKSSQAGPEHLFSWWHNIKHSVGDTNICCNPLRARNLLRSALSLQDVAKGLPYDFWYDTCIGYASLRRKRAEGFV